MGFLQVFLVVYVAVGRITGVNIEIFIEQKAVECGNQLTLTCWIKTHSSLVAWMFEGDAVPIATCSRHSSSVNAKYSEKFRVDYNLTEGYYNLTIKELTFAEIGKTCLCSNGYTSVSKEISLQDYRALLLEDTKTGVITATSGYVSPDTDVKMQWTKINAADNQESGFHPQLLFTDAKSFSNVTLCSSNQLMQHSATIYAKPSLSGRYYLKIAVTYGNETVVYNITTLKYIIEEQGLSNGMESDALKEVRIRFIIITVVLILTQTIIFVVVFCIRKHWSGGLSTNRWSRMQMVQERTNSEIEVPVSSEEMIIREMRSILRDDSGSGYSLKYKDSGKTRYYTFKFRKDKDISVEEETYQHLRSQDKDSEKYMQEMLNVEVRIADRDSPLGYGYSIKDGDSEKTRHYTSGLNTDLFVEEKTDLSLEEEPDLSLEEETDLSL